MEDQNINDKIKYEYMIKFDCDLPHMIMCQSDASYLEMLKMAIDRGSPITDKDYEELFPTEDENGNPILY